MGDAEMQFYLRGLHHFEHITDHRPLILILNYYTLNAVENLLPHRLKEKLSPYIFTACCRSGEDLCISDALSRSPITSPHEDKDTLADVSMQNTVALRAMSSLIS